MAAGIPRERRWEVRHPLICRREVRHPLICRREVRHPGSQTPRKSDTQRSQTPTEKSDTHRLEVGHPFVVGWMPSAAICGPERCAETVLVDTSDVRAQWLV